MSDGLTTTRAEHLAWCKRRALEYVDAGDVVNGITSMMSDMTKHPETGVPMALQQLAFLYMMNKDADGARRWIIGFN